MSDDIKAAQRACYAVCEANPDWSVVDVARHLHNEFGYGLLPGEITIIRNAVKQRHALKSVIPTRAVRVTEVVPVCSNCGGEHYVSRCTKPFPEKPIQLTQPIAPEVTVDTTASQFPEAPKPPETPKPPPLFHRPPVQAPPPSLVHEHHLGRQKVKGMWIRRAYLNEMLDADPGADPQALIVRVRERFGMGIDLVYVYETCRIARQIARLPQISTKEVESRNYANGRQPLPYVTANEDESPPLDEELRQLAMQAREVMRAHGLTGLTVDLDESTAKWSYRIERSGSGEAVL